MNLVDILIHIANITYVIGSSFKKIIYLRIFFVIGSIFEILYIYLLAPKNFWTLIVWSILLMLVNIIMLMIFVYEKNIYRLKDDEKFLFQTVFSRMDKVNFKRMLEAGSWVNITKGDVLIYENQTTDFLMLLFQGRVEVLVGDKQITILNPGSFIGEMSFLTGSNTTATAKAITNVKLYAWKKTELIKLLSKNIDLDREMRSIFSSDLISKLITKNEKSR